MNESFVSETKSFQGSKDSQTKAFQLIRRFEKY